MIMILKAKQMLLIFCLEVTEMRGQILIFHQITLFEAKFGINVVPNDTCSCLTYYVKKQISTTYRYLQNILPKM
jgi:hypothetical protein